MNYNLVYSIAAQGMQIEKLRIDTVAYNIANQHSLLKSDGSGFQPMQVIAPSRSFNDYLTESGEWSTAALAPKMLPPNKVYQPEHPEADEQGYIHYPGINTVDEMTTLLNASRAYEANIKVFNTAHSLFMQTFTIGDER
ncbi:flagellar basal body rod protein FlgC [Legionella birminghamensis]|uniref:Flagellar basal-body rod protein FlgC n=1 Tax=Legionella birminghamensis TaxID=28083 RepID=A0A378I883_9GAMM|nr:flagellar basal body rod protein FlgC [Legionella birminghamensis]KTC68302.1 flagellar basal body rod protein FlgC [Legionella birminghamensis]STX30985.1 flagellar basal-body rod protein FlgC [Legionella birminghamensis]